MENNSQITLEHVNPLIADYEVLIKTLTEQLSYYKQEQDILRNDITVLLAENKKLSSCVKEYIEKSEQTLCAEINHKYNDSDLVTNLKGQIDMLIKEKESSFELWRNSLATIDQLEQELSLFEGRTHGYIPKAEVKKLMSRYEKRIKDLEVEQIKAEVTLTDLKRNSCTSLSVKESELKTLGEKYDSILVTNKSLETKVQKLKTECDKIRERKIELENSLQEKVHRISNLKDKENESKLRVNEAVYVVEAALVEKDAALIRENEAKEKLTQMSDAISKAAEETNEKMKLELETAKKIYNEKVQKLKQELKNVMMSLAEKNSQLEVHKSSLKVLEERLDKLSKGSFDMESHSTSKLLILEKNLETTFQKLLLSEKRNIQIEAERQLLREDLEQMANMYERDIKTRDSEKRILENKVTSLQNDLEVSNTEVIEVANKVSEVNSKIAVIDSELKKQLYLNDIKNEKKLANKIREIELSNNKINGDLLAKLESQISFNHKWKNELKDITTKLNNRVTELKEEVRELKAKNKDLKRKLNTSNVQIDLYKEQLMELCIDVKNIATISREPTVTNVSVTKDAGSRNEINS